MKNKMKYKVVGYQNTKCLDETDKLKSILNDTNIFTVGRFETKKEAIAFKDTLVKNMLRLIYKRTIFGNAHLIYWDDALDYERHSRKQKF